MLVLLFVIILLFASVSYCQNVIPVGSYPCALVYNAANAKVYCANYGDNTVSVVNVNNNQVITT
ncbi:MAG: hypothetical protein KGZ86_04560, partial [Candidatus Latescibacteria bacterium]|nr:hypothetical protein [Candidatus Latescibacterota bacterium]